MKKKVLSVMLIAGLLSATACKDTDNDSQGSNELAQDLENQVTGATLTESEQGGMNGMEGVGMTGDQFAKDAAEGGMLEVQLGNLAQKNGSSQQVKQYGQTMVKDHGAANQELKAIAKNKGINLPTTPSQQGMNKFNQLSALKGAEFDRAYTQMMVESHQSTIGKFMAFSQGTGATANAQTPATGVAAASGTDARKRGDGPAGRETAAGGGTGTAGGAAGTAGGANNEQANTAGNTGTSGAGGAGTAASAGATGNAGAGAGAASTGAAGTGTAARGAAGTGTAGTGTAGNTSDAELRTWASKKLPALKMHLEMAQKMLQTTGGTAGTAASQPTAGARR